jgi:hypothetical protein
VQNVLTGAWCRFLGLDAWCWELANGCVYFGGQDADGLAAVFQWDKGASDNGAAIVGDVKSAFTDFGDGRRNKAFKMIRPILRTIPVVQPALEVDVDFRESSPVAVPTVVRDGGAGLEVRYDWTGASGIGYVGAARMQVSLASDPSTPVLAADGAIGDLLAIDGAGDNLQVAAGLPFDAPCQLLGFDLVYEPGGQV